MKHHETQISDPVERIRAIREKNYEATKNMTREERSEYYQKKVDAYEERRKQINLEDYDFPFLRKK